MASLLESELASSVAYYETQNLDARGEYRGRKYDRALGTEYGAVVEDAPVMDAGAPIEDLAACVAKHGCVLLKNAIPLEKVEAFAEKHAALIDGDFAPLQEALRDARAAAEAGGESAKSFYKGELAGSCGLRLRTTARGRYDLKHLDRRDGPPRGHAALQAAVEPLVLPPVVRALLSRLMATPWRVKTVGSLPTAAGAAGGDWHRDIGEGLFGEDLDLRLPDYYFNALVPLGAAAPAAGTEIVLGSHATPVAGLEKASIAVAAGAPGDVFFFNGKCVHRGRPNPTDAGRRDLVYVVYAAKWFEQGRDPTAELDAYHSAAPPGGDRAIKRAHN